MANAIENTDQKNEQDFVDELKPGTKLLHGQYTIESFLNSGGFGITYLARDSLDRQVVIKECFPGALCRRGASRVGARSRAHQAEFGAVVERFVQEARNMAKLDHPNIVGVHQVFEDNDTAYMALDYIDGFDLMDEIDEGMGKMPPSEVTRILRKLLGAIEFIHERNILHRDISPDNILIEKKSGEPLLIDFGAAREEVAKTSRVLSALRVVKDGYSPQEFYINGSSQGPSSDLYALAATFYHLVAGEAPPDSQSRLSALAQDESDPCEPLATNKKLLEEYDVTFLSAIDKALNVFPKDRIQSAGEWLAMISSGVSELRTNTAQTNSATKGKTKAVAASKSKSKGLLVTVSIVAISAVIGLAVWQSGMLDSKADAPDAVSAAPSVVLSESETATQDTEEGVAAAAEPEEVAVVEGETQPDVEEVIPPTVTEETQPVEDVEVAQAPDAVVIEPETTAQDADEGVTPTAEPEEVAVVENETPIVVADETQPVVEETELPIVTQEAEVVEPPLVSDVIMPEGMSAMQGPDGLILPEGVELIAPQVPSDDVTETAAEPSAVGEETESLAATDDTLPESDVEVAALLPEENSTQQDPDGLLLPEGVTLIDPTEDAVAAEASAEATAPVSGIEFVASAILPFSGSGASPNTVVKHDRSAPEWMQIGQRIVAVNGRQIQSFEEINPILREMTDLQNLDTVDAVLSVVAFAGAAPIQKTTPLEVVHDLVLPGGLVFREQKADDNQKNTVVIASQESEGGLLVGDIVVGLMDTGERIDVDISLKEALLRETAKGVTKFSLLVFRDGNQWVTPFELKDAEINPIRENRKPATEE